MIFFIHFSLFIFISLSKKIKKLKKRCHRKIKKN